MDGSGTRSLSETNEGDESGDSESHKSISHRAGSLVAIINYTFIQPIGGMNLALIVCWVCRVHATKESMEG